ncbi:MAG: RNA polymerase sigma factor [Deltaproteobacteria bacterium]|nr:RNA polymerase sigma factor [Deltaproteobacteria bacterium]
MKRQDDEKLYQDALGKIDVLKLYDTYYDDIFRYVLNRTGDVEMSRDITADVFFKVYRHRWKYVFTSAPVSAWLYRIAGNEVVSAHRNTTRRPLLLDGELQHSDVVPVALRGDLQEEIQQAQEQVNRNAAFQRVNQQLKKLPSKYQEVIVLRYLEEKSIKEIALLLGKREGTVKSLISRGISQLKRISFTEKDFFAQNGLLVEARTNEGVN